MGIQGRGWALRGRDEATTKMINSTMETDNLENRRKMNTAEIKKGTGEPDAFF
jgi:hypothetical protein